MTESPNHTNVNPNSNSYHTLHDYLSIIVPEYIQLLKCTLDDCQQYTQRIKDDSNITLDSPSNIYTQEQLYHCNGTHDLKNTVDQTLEIFEFNNYVPGYKLLTHRTQDYLFAKCMLAYFPSEINETPKYLVPVSLQLAIKKLCQSGLVDWLRHCVITHPDVELFMKPIADRFKTFVQHEITRLDSIPHVEQKTDAWHNIRKNMISASVAGYIDSDACGSNKSNEITKIEEKSGLKSTRPFSWGCLPLRHGQQFEDVSGHIYNTFNRLHSKEYGILPDYRYAWLGASPDGVITDVSPANTRIRPNTSNTVTTTSSNILDTTVSYTDTAMLGRMREIKNPVSRTINDKIPSFYYWQMLQQMYVCQLPICDFIQTQIKYPNTCDFKTYNNDTIPLELINNATCWQDHHSYLATYVMENIDWHTMNLFLIKHFNLLATDTNDTGHTDRSTSIGSIHLDTADNMLANTLSKYFKQITHIAPENINNRGQLKGVLWCFTKEDTNGEIDFKVEFTEMYTATNNETELHQHKCMLVDKYAKSGFKLSEQHYWNLEEYKVNEVEYNQCLYEGKNHFIADNTTTTTLPPTTTSHIDNCIISRLLHKWNIINELRAIDDLDSKRSKFLEYYPSKPNKTTKAALSRKNAMSTTTALGNPKYYKRKNSNKPRQRGLFNLD